MSYLEFGRIGSFLFEDGNLPERVDGVIAPLRMRVFKVTAADGQTTLQGFAHSLQHRIKQYKGPYEYQKKYISQIPVCFDFFDDFEKVCPHGLIYIAL